MIGVAVALALTTAPDRVPAPPPTSAASTVRASRETAAALARTVAPPDVLVPREIDQAQKAILSLPSIDEDAKALEGEYPGIWAAVWAASEPEMRRSVEADYPKFWAALEGLYLSRLSETEARALIEFYRSPTGQKLLQGMAANFDAKPIIEQAVKSPSAPVTGKQLDSLLDAAKAKAVEGMGPADTVAMLTLLHDVDLEKFRTLGEETQKLTLDWLNKDDAEGDARLERIMQSAMQQYISKHSAKK